MQNFSRSYENILFFDGGARFSPDRTRPASGNEDNTASLFARPEGTLIRNPVGHAQPVTSVDFSPAGKLLATSGDGTA